MRCVSCYRYCISASRALRGCPRGRGGVRLYAPNVAIHNHSVSFERILGWAAQHLARAYVELRAVKRTRHRRSVEFAFAQWTLPVRALILGGAESSGDVEDHRIAHQQGRSSRHFTHPEFIFFECGWVA